MIKQCIHCKKNFFKPYFCSKKNWVMRQFCSRPCSNFYTLFKKGYQRPKWIQEKAIQSITGINNKHWKGEKAGYSAFHGWLRTNFGKANKCENPDCNEKSFNYNWCLKKGFNHGHFRENYIQMCISCHRKYDFTESLRQKLSFAHKGQIPWNKGKRI